MDSKVLKTISPVSNSPQEEFVTHQFGETLNTLIKASPLAIIAVDRSANVLIWNPAAEILFGWNEQEVIGRPYPLLPESDLPAFKALLEKEFKGTQQNASDVKRMHKDGHSIDVNLWTAPLNDNNGEMYAVLAMVADNTARKRAEQQLKLLDTAVKSTADAVMITDLKSDIVWVNPSFTTLSGYSTEESIGKKPQDLLKSNMHDHEFFKEMWKTIISGHVWQGETINKRKDGTLFTENQTISPVRNQQGEITHFISIKQDITERKQAEEKIKRLYRLYKVSNSINTLIVRVQDRKELFHKACQIAVNEGMFRMVWIGMLSMDKKRIIPRIWAGNEDGYLQKIKPSLVIKSDKNGSLCAEAINTREFIFCNDIEEEATGFYWQQEALDRGYQSMVALPLIVGNEAVGVMSLYSSEKNFFDEQEKELLNELTIDISFALQSIQQQEKLDFLASYDPLTGLPNRALFINHLDYILGMGKQTSKNITVLVCGLKHFRHVNNAFGRIYGDMILKEFATRLQKLSEDRANVGRITGDYFAMILSNISDIGDIVHKFQNSIKPALCKPYSIDNNQIQVDFVAGMAVYPTDGEDAESLYHNAEIAMTRARESNQKCLFYQPEMSHKATESILMENRLTKALENDHFILHYQPKIDPSTYAIKGLEALIRWEDPENGLVMPDKFISLLESCGMIIDVGKWAMKRALQDAEYWSTQCVTPPHIAVNISALQLQQPNFVSTVAEVIKQFNGHGCLLELEVTESLFMENIEDSIEKLEEIRKMGVNIIVDDFGTGYSSLGYLSKLPVNALKIDRSFVITMDRKPENMTIVNTIITLAHSLDLKVIAEGVETEEQAKLLRLLKCDEMQGYLFSMPLPPDETLELLKKS